MFLGLVMIGVVKVVFGRDVESGFFVCLLLLFVVWFDFWFFMFGYLYCDMFV